jgi:hypothetical protein
MRLVGLQPGRRTQSIPGGARETERHVARAATRPEERRATALPQVITYTGAGLTPVHFVQVTVSSSAVGLELNGHDPKRVRLTAEGDIRYRFDADPTSSVGHPLAAGANLEIIGREAIERFKMIRQSSNAVVSYTVEV